MIQTHNGIELGKYTRKSEYVPKAFQPTDREPGKMYSEGEALKLMECVREAMDRAARDTIEFYQADAETRLHAPQRGKACVAAIRFRLPFVTDRFIGLFTYLELAMREEGVDGVVLPEGCKTKDDLVTKMVHGVKGGLRIWVAWEGDVAILSLRQRPQSSSEPDGDTPPHPQPSEESDRPAAPSRSSRKAR